MTASALYVVAFPEFTPDDDALLRRLRAEHHPLEAAAIGPHFTLMFAVPDETPAALLAHVAAAARGADPVAFRLSECVALRDPLGDDALVYLLPDEGAAELEALRARLHAGRFADLRRDGPAWAPHVTLGRFETLDEARAVAGGIADFGLSLSGRVAALSVAERVDDAIVLRGDVALG